MICPPIPYLWPSLHPRARIVARSLRKALYAGCVLRLATYAYAASPTLLLQESGVSRGSFYSFFETPEKVLEELAFQCMQESAGLLDDMLQVGPIAHWPDVVDIIIEFYNEAANLLVESDPNFAVVHSVDHSCVYKENPIQNVPHLRR